MIIAISREVKGAGKSLFRRYTISPNFRNYAHIRGVLIFLFPKKYVILGSFWSEFGAKIVKYKPLLVHTYMGNKLSLQSPKIGLVRLVSLVRVNF